MDEEGLWTVEAGEGPVIATAIHAGHHLRPEVAARMRLTDAERLREEDPFTDQWTQVGDTRIVVHRSRFEVDLNRPREGAVYVTPEQSWGLDVWTEPLPCDLIQRSLAIRERFYARLEPILADKVSRHGRFIVYDLHSYNHRREGPDAAPADAVGNPEVNVGTGSMDRARWAGVVDAFIRVMRAFGGASCTLDVRENVRFRGGYLAQFVHERFPEHGCVLAIEFKKTFMDEWTGEPDWKRIEWLREALRASVPGVVRALER